jgi:hypothetical protein
MLSAVRARGRLEDELDSFSKANAGLRAQAAQLQTMQASQARECAEVSRTIGELQAQVARQSQDLTFYKGLVTRDPNAPEVKIQQLQIVRGAKPLAYVIRITLARPAVGETQLTGTIVLSVAGQNGTRTDTLTLPQQSYTLKYFQNLQTELTLPATFKPERLQAEVRSARRGVEPLLQSFVWVVEAN